MLTFTPSTLKYWIRSGSLSYALNYSSPSSNRHVSRMTWQQKSIYYRPGTSDVEILYKILFKPESKREYQRPEIANPRVILDLGANIGAASIWLSSLFPGATIYSFEP